MRKALAACAVGLAIIAVVGCGKHQFPKARVEPIKEFSLGSATVEPLSKKPTAEEVYSVALRLYDSLDSVAATCDLTESMTAEWAKAQGKSEDTGRKPIKARVDSRYVRPDKMLVKRTGDEPVVVVQNGGDTLIYYPERRTYEQEVTPKGVVEAMPPSVAGWLQFLPPGDRQVEGMGLTADSKLGSADVYVLKIRLPGRRLGQGYVPAEVRTFYLGKKDLLPLRIEVTTEMQASEGGAPRPVDKRTVSFSGFTANVKVPDTLFSTKPPKGARREKRPGTPE